ncbi:hypothetical protein UlMin_025491 [Ulmus minor]
MSLLKLFGYSNDKMPLQYIISHRCIYGTQLSLSLFFFNDILFKTNNIGFNYLTYICIMLLIFLNNFTRRWSNFLDSLLSSFLGIKSPVAYRWRKSVKKSKVKYGMNFAFGGRTGVFNTFGNEPNMSTQIDLFRQLLDQQQFCTKQDLKTSTAFNSLAGNDYAAHIAKGANNMEVSLVELIISRPCLSMGVPKIDVTALEPLGCLPPFITASSSFQNCSTTWNSVSHYQNQILQQKIEMGSLVGVLMKRGKKKNSLCKEPELSFFWDMIHPSHSGRHAVFSELLRHSSLCKLVN